MGKVRLLAPRARVLVTGSVTNDTKNIRGVFMPMICFSEIIASFLKRSENRGEIIPMGIFFRLKSPLFGKEAHYSQIAF